MGGFRSLAYVDEHETRLISREGNTYKRFLELAAAIHMELDCEAVIDGEIVCLDSEGVHGFMTCSADVVNPSSTRSICFGWMARICDGGP